MTLPPHTPGPDGGSPADDDPGPVNQGVSPMGDAFAWASQIIAIGLAMFLPAVAGNWLDARLGTRFLGPAGLVFGMPCECKDGSYKIIHGLEIDDYAREKINITLKELTDEADAVKGMGMV